jgi:predicted ATP-grasp superfamily ATP-dependent carboligase
MRIFVCEYITGGGLLNEAIPPSLAREGELMLGALARDLADVGGLSLVVSRDPRMPPLSLAGEAVVADAHRDIWATWRAIISEVDAVWPIAPETGGVLARLSTEVLAHDRILLGSRPDALAVAASKLATIRRLEQAGVGVVPTFPVASAPLESAASWVVKPDDGVGCLDARCVSRDALRVALANNTLPAGYVAQPYIEGMAASLSLICRQGSAWLLSCNRQRVGLHGGEFQLEGVVVNGIARAVAEFEVLAERIASALPGLWGYVGVDLIMAPDGPLVLEVNPRLTTSYVGLRAALAVNPAALVLALSREDPKVPDQSMKRAPVNVDIELGCAA